MTDGEKLTAKLKHFELIQAVVTRMANNSFMVKAWCITLVAALLALAGGKDGNAKFVYVAYLPLFTFWYLDGFFLQQERIFRKIYDLYIGALNTGSPPTLVAAPATDYKITPLSLPDTVKDELKRNNTIPVVMWSNTLRVFYGAILISLLAVTTFLNGRINGLLTRPYGKLIALTILLAISLSLTERIAFYLEWLVRKIPLGVKLVQWFSTKPK